MIYIDRSGSFTPEKTDKVQVYIDKIISRYGRLIEKHFRYFGDSELRSIDNKAGGNTPYDLVIQDINTQKAELNIVITDDDSARGCGNTKEKVWCIAIGCEATSLSKEIGCKNFVFS